MSLRAALEAAKGQRNGGEKPGAGSRGAGRQSGRGSQKPKKPVSHFGRRLAGGEMFEAHADIAIGADAKVIADEILDTLDEPALKRMASCHGLKTQVAGLSASGGRSTGGKERLKTILKTHRASCNCKHKDQLTLWKSAPLGQCTDPVLGEQLTGYGGQLVQARDEAASEPLERPNAACGLRVQCIAAVQSCDDRQHCSSNRLRMKHCNFPRILPLTSHRLLPARLPSPCTRFMPPSAHPRTRHATAEPRQACSPEKARRQRRFCPDRRECSP